MLPAIKLFKNKPLLNSGHQSEALQEQNCALRHSIREDSCIVLAARTYCYSKAIYYSKGNSAAACPSLRGSEARSSPLRQNHAVPLARLPRCW